MAKIDKELAQALQQDIWEAEHRGAKATMQILLELGLLWSSSDAKKVMNGFNPRSIGTVELAELVRARLDEM